MQENPRFESSEPFLDSLSHRETHSPVTSDRQKSKFGDFFEIPETGTHTIVLRTFAKRDGATNHILRVSDKVGMVLFPEVNERTLDKFFQVKGKELLMMTVFMRELRKAGHQHVRGHLTSLDKDISQGIDAIVSIQGRHYQIDFTSNDAKAQSLCSQNNSTFIVYFENPYVKYLYKKAMETHFENMVELQSWINHEESVAQSPLIRMFLNGKEYCLKELMRTHTNKQNRRPGERASQSAIKRHQYLLRTMRMVEDENIEQKNGSSSSTLDYNKQKI